MDFARFRDQRGLCEFLVREMDKSQRLVDAATTDATRFSFSTGFEDGRVSGLNIALAYIAGSLGTTAGMLIAETRKGMNQ